MGRAPCCDKASVKKGPWSPEEDAKLKEYIEKHGTGGNWIAFPQKAGLKRCGKSCRLRWLNYLRPNIKHGEFSEEEDRIICSLYVTIGSRWSIIAAQLPGRTDNDIKNYWNTKLKKKLMASIATPNNKNSSSSTSSSLSRSPSSSLTYYQYPMLHSSSPISSSSPHSFSTSSPYQCKSSTPYYNSPTPSTTTSLTFTGLNFGRTQNYYQQVKDTSTLLMFSDTNTDVQGHNQTSAAAASCSSSDGSISSNVDCNFNTKSTEEQVLNITQENYNERGLMLDNNGHHQYHQEEVKASGNGVKNAGLWGHESQSSIMNYGLEEIKQLMSTNISTVSSNFSYFDQDGKGDDSTKIMQYY